MLLTIAINLLIVGYIAIREFRGDAANASFVSLSEVKWVFIALGVLCFVLAVYLEYVKYRKMIQATQGRDDRRSAFECAVLGKYYDNVTPFGAGGQPFQILYLRRKGFSGGSCAAIPVAGFMMLQFAFVLIALVVFVANRDVIDMAPAIRYTAYLGLLMYAALPVAIVFFAFFPRGVRAVVGRVTGFLGQLNLLKDSEKTAAGILGSLDEYVVSLRAMNRRPHFTAKLMSYSVLYQLAVLSVPYFMLLAFGGTKDWWTVFSLVVYIYAAITIVPTPGNAGAAEGSFYAVFSSLQGGFLFWAMIAWRLIVYYFWLFLGLIVVARSASTRPRKRKRSVPGDGPLRVALFTDRFFPGVDGVVRTVHAYAKELTAAGHEVCVVCPKETDAPEDRFGYHVLRTPSVRMRIFATAIPLPTASHWIVREFRRSRFDVLHAHSPFAEGDLAFLLGRKLGVPVVATFHSKYYDDALNVTHSRFIAKMMMNRVVDFYSKADEVWACSESTAETLRSYGYMGEIRVMENGADPAPVIAPEELRRQAKEAFHLPEDKRLILFVGQQIWQKNLRLVLDVSRRLAELREDCVTVIAGTGFNAEDIKRYAEKLGLGQRVIFTGPVTDRNLLFGLYLSSELFFFPSLYDNAPLVVREAALAGLPSLLVEGSNAAEIVRDGENGYTAPEDKDLMCAKIQRILDDPDRAAVGERAKETIPVSWKDIVERVVEAYREEFSETALARRK